MAARRQQTSWTEALIPNYQPTLPTVQAAERIHGLTQGVLEPELA